MKVLFEEGLPNTILVNVMPPTVGPSIAHFVARIKNGTDAQACNVSAFISPLQCRLTHLMQPFTHIVEVRSCVPGTNGWGVALEKLVILRMLQSLF